METTLEELLVKGAAGFGVHFGENEVTLYFKYLRQLLEWNEKVNLTAIKAPDEIVIKHFLDSISLLPYLQQKEKIRLLDVGSGAGFPGVPLKIANPEIDVVLLDSLKKRILFLDSLITELNLKGVTTVHGRAEDYGHCKGYREGFNVVTSRAVAKLSVLAELCLPFVRVGGVFAAYKGPRGKEELIEAENALKILGGKLTRLVEISLPQTDETRMLIIIRKEKATPQKYPRKAGTPEKKPLCKHQHL